MANTAFAYCQQCGKKLTMAFFCLPCKASFCCQSCYRRHKLSHCQPAAEHRRPNLANKATGTGS
jgi:hypothetical protein